MRSSSGRLCGTTTERRPLLPSKVALNQNLVQEKSGLPVNHPRRPTVESRQHVLGGAMRHDRKVITLNYVLSSTGELHGSVIWRARKRRHTKHQRQIAQNFTVNTYRAPKTLPPQIRTQPKVSNNSHQVTALTPDVAEISFARRTVGRSQVVAPAHQRVQ